MKDLKNVKSFFYDMITLCDKYKIQIDIDGCQIFFEGQFLGLVEDNIEEYDIVLGEDVVLTINNTSLSSNKK